VSSFDARLRVPGQARLPLNVAVEVADDRITFTSGDKPLGDWLIAEIEVELKPDGFHLQVDHEEIVLTVTDPAGFANALGIGTRRLRPVVASEAPGAEAVLSDPNGSAKRNAVASRLESITPEERFADVVQRVSELKSALTNDSVEPQDVFGRWLRLLKEINMRHGQGAMPTPLFYRLNTELLEIIPVPPRVPSLEGQPIGAGVGM
jgi:hypothetical protein